MTAADERDTSALEDTPTAEQTSGSLLSSRSIAHLSTAWEWISWTGYKTYDAMDFAGEVLANFLGLTQSQYQWIISIRERELEEKQLRRLEARQRRQIRLQQLLEEEKQKLRELEQGDALDITASNGDQDLHIAAECS